MTCDVDAAQVAYDAVGSDGCWPLITNDKDMTGAQVLAAYRYQPNLERRHHLLKGIQDAAPIWIKTITRIEAIFLCHFIALLISALIERQIRTAMQAAGIARLATYPEFRGCAAPTADRIFEILRARAAARAIRPGWHPGPDFRPELTPLQLKILELLDVPATAYTKACGPPGGRPLIRRKTQARSAERQAEVVGYSGYRIALIFLPMTVLMTVTALLAGRRTATAGTRWSVSAGCVTFGAGLLLTAATISPDPSFPRLAAELALTGIGIGIGSTVVPITSWALSAVRPGRSGMAASATNTSREIGAVLGVAVLGALVNFQLYAHLTERLRHLGIPADFHSIVINAIETGAVPQAARRKTQPAPPGRVRKSSCRTSSTPPTVRSTPGCTPRYSCPRH